MKKKFLSLMMAAAVVATTSVSAFASTTQTIKESDEVGGQAQITVTGDVEDSEGHTKPGTLNVTVPTAASFTVNKDKKFVGTEIKVQNNGTQDIDVFAYEFIDSTKNSGITVKKKSEAQNGDKTNIIALRLEGNSGVAHFASEAGSYRGVYDNEEHNATGPASEDGIKIANVLKGDSYDLRLRGDLNENANVVSTPESDTFTLRLKIKKA
ncbi:hypothetical protein [Clostridium sp.]|uniref:hypothetical protein n=1 Tax=Clostridium sp. TaxID=1506 RepID=UPI003990711A